MMIKKEDNNTGVSNENLIKNFKNSALSRYLIKSIKSTLSNILSTILKLTN